MPLKGLAYPRTTWAFQERPVASAKLNTWDDRIAAALELVFFPINMAWDGDDGVIQGATTDDLAVKATSPVSLRVEARPGYAFISNMPFKLAQTTETPTITAPASQDRIDLVQASLVDWSISVKTGAEAATPSAPTPDTDCIPLAELFLRPGMSSIKDTDDATNGYITDTRNLL